MTPCCNIQFCIIIIEIISISIIPYHIIIISVIQYFNGMRSFAQRSFADIPDVIEDDIVYPEDSGCHGDNDADDDQVMKVAQLGQGLYPGHDANHYGGNATRRRIR